MTGEAPKVKLIINAIIRTVKGYGIGYFLDIANEYSKNSETIVGPMACIIGLVAVARIYEHVTSDNKAVTQDQVIIDIILELLPTMLQIGNIVTKIPILNNACTYASVTIGSIRSINRCRNGEISSGMAVELISSNILSIVASGLAGAAVTASVASVAPAIAVIAGSAIVATTVGWGVSRVCSGIWSMFKKSVLVIEDNPVNQRSTYEMLTNNGYHCMIANNQQEALKLYESLQYQIIFIHIQVLMIHALEITNVFES